MYHTICLLLSLCAISLLAELDKVSKMNLLQQLIAAAPDKCVFECPGGVKPTEDPDEHTLSIAECEDYAKMLEIDVSAMSEFEQCCEVHDKCYTTCNTNQDECDENFKKCLKNSCTTSYKGKKGKEADEGRETCDQSATILGGLSVAMGCDGYQEGQRNACLCNGEKVQPEEEPEKEPFFRSTKKSTEKSTKNPTKNPIKNEL